MRVTFVNHHLACGGVERTVSLMANYWAEKGWNITILTLAYGDSIPFFDLHPAILVRDVGILEDSGLTETELAPLLASAEGLHIPRGEALSSLIETFQRIMKLRQAIVDTEPEWVIAFSDIVNMYVLLAVQSLPISVIATEISDPFQRFFRVCLGEEEGKRYEILQRRLYKRAAYVVTPTEEALNYFSPDIGARGRAIPNPVLPPSSTALDRGRRAQVSGYTMMALGRLISLKGFDLLLQAFALVAPKHPTWSLAIWGEGPCRHELERLIDQLRLSGRARLCGVTHKPYEILRQADLFVVSSRAESFCNVLCEAMACQLAVVSFSVQGPRHIIRDGVDGVLVPPEDVSALAETLDRLMRDEAERQRLAYRAPEVLDRFGIDRIMGAWEKLIV